MNSVEISRLILESVERHGAIKHIDLALDVMAQVNPCRFDAELYQQALDHLVQNNELIEIEYILPRMDYRIKSVYFPKGTTFDGIRFVSRIISKTVEGASQE